MSKDVKKTAKEQVAKDNTAKIEALWAQYGKLQADRENVANTLERINQQMRIVYAEIEKNK